MRIYSSHPSPIDDLMLISDTKAIVGIHMQKSNSFTGVERDWVRKDNAPEFNLLKRELDAFFDGKLQRFTTPVKLIGTPFRVDVWRLLKRIPFGKTVSYGYLAQKLQLRGARAIGQAVGENPVSILIPCHRVIGTDGSLTGFGGGLARKLWLLEHEGHSFR